MEEIWKDVPGFEGLYQASTEGNIRSLNFRGTKGRIHNMKSKVSKTGYYRVILWNKDKKEKEYQWGQIVAKTFIPNPENKPLVKYLDKDRTNNKPSNLAWATYQEVAVECLPDKKIEFRGKTFKNEKEIAKYYGVDYKAYLKRKKRGWSIEETVTVPVDKKNCCGKPFYYNYYGKPMTLEEISKITGIRKQTIQYRIYAGWDLYSAAEIPVNIYKK